MESSQTERCPKCGKDISKPNFEIHQAMCKGVRESFIMNVNDEQYKRFSEDSEKRLSQQQDNPQNLEKPKYPDFDFLPQQGEQEDKTHKGKPIQPEVEIKPKRVLSADEKYPCSNCGYMMNMAELDTHPLTCVVHPKACPFCKDEYPEDLMNEHKQVCEKRPRQPPRVSPRVSPRASPRVSPRVNAPIREETRDVIDNGRRVRLTRRTFADGTSTTTRRVLDEQDDGPYIFIGGPQGFQRANFPDLFFRGTNSNRSGGSVEHDPFRRIIEQLMNQMNVNRSEHPGMPEEQVRRLPVVRFDKNTNGKKCPNCTICIKDYNDGDVLIKLPCGHLFNKECLVPWLKTSSVCPNCRNPVVRQRAEDDD